MITPTGEQKLLTIEASDRRIFKKSGWENVEKVERQKGIPDPASVAENQERSRRRALRTMTELIMCNPFDWFMTLTLSPEAVDRESYEGCEHLFSRWMSNQVQRKGASYISVPEYHKDGKSIHFHLLANGAFKMTDSGHMRSGKPVYNITSWKHGFSTAQAITGGEVAQIKVAKYCTKYMTKGAVKVGGRWYLSGGKLNRPVEIFGETPGEIMEKYGVEPIYHKKTEGLWGTYERYSFV